MLDLSESNQTDEIKIAGDDKGVISNPISNQIDIRNVQVPNTAEV